MRRALATTAAFLVIAGCGSRTGLLEGDRGVGADGGASADAFGAERDVSSIEGNIHDDAFPDVAAGDDSGDATSRDAGPGDGSSVPCGSGLVALASKQRSPYGLAVNSTHAYWTTFLGGTVMKVPLCGGVPTTLATSAGPSYIALDPTGVYWTQNAGAECPGCIAILKVPFIGGASTVIASQVNETSLGMAIGAPAVLWVAQEVGVMSAPLSGGTATTLASEPGGTSSGIAVDATNVYWTYLTSPIPKRVPSVMSAPLAGGARTTLASGPAVGASSSELQSIAVNSTGVYWGSSDAISGVPKSGGIPAKLAVPWGPTQPGDLAVDETNVYWVNDGKRAVMKAPLAGGAPVTLATGQDHPRAIVVDASSVYWATASSAGPDHFGDIMRLTPK